VRNGRLTNRSDRGEQSGSYGKHFKRCSDACAFPFYK